MDAKPNAQNSSDLNAEATRLFLEPLRRLHDRIRESVVAACESSAVESLAEVEREDAAGDTIYAVDKVSEEIIIEFFEQEIAESAPLVLIAEGLETGKVVLPRGVNEREARWRVVVDPIDGTRGLMYQKRAAWILTGVAPNLGDRTNLQDIVLAVQTEIPLVKQFLSDQLWASKGTGVQAERFNRLTGETQKLNLRPSKSASIAHGFASIARFFPGMNRLGGEIYEEIVRGALGTVVAGKAQCFEDQYISTGGELYELICGHDRFVADLRPVFEKTLARQNLRLGICCHPYDLCTELIAREAGVIVTDERGAPLSAPLDVDANVAWAGYANENIRRQIEPLLQNALEQRELVEFVNEAQ